MTPITLRIVLPHRVFHEEAVWKIRAAGAQGSFCLLPRHLDCVAELIPGILTCESAEGEERAFAVDGGILVKRGREVQVSTPHAVRGGAGRDLSEAVRQSFRNMSEREQRTRSALRRIEADFVRTFMETEENVVRK